MKQEAVLGDPRNITVRTDQYLVRVGPVINAIEQKVLKQYTVKGLNLNQRAEKMLNVFGIRDGDYLETDYSRFDQTILPELLEFEQDFYLQYYNDPEFEWLIRQQSVSHGCHVQGIPYKREGGRCSGDANTSIGNCFINLFVAYIAHCRLGRPIVGFVEGDDGLFLDSDGLADSFEWVATALGLRLKCVRTNNPKFCGRYHDKNWNSTSELARLIPKFSHSFNKVLDVKELAKAKLHSLRALEPNHPLLGPCITHMLNELVDTPLRLSRAQKNTVVYETEVAIDMATLAEQGYTVSYLQYMRDYFTRLAREHVHTHEFWPSPDTCGELKTVPAEWLCYGFV